MARLNKQKAITTLLNHSRATEYVARVIQSNPQFSCRKSRLLKYAANMVNEGFSVTIDAYECKPCINGRKVSWNAFDIVGGAFYKESIHKDQMFNMIKQYSDDIAE